MKNVSFDVLDMIFGNIHWQLLFSNLEGTFVLSLELWPFIFLRSSATADYHSVEINININCYCSFD